MTQAATKKFHQLQGLAQYVLQEEYKILCVLLSLCTDATLGLQPGIPAVEQQGLGDAQDPFFLYLSFFGEKDLFKVQRKTCTSLSHLWQGEGSVFLFGSFSSFF